MRSKSVVVFGNSTFASLAWFSLSNDSPWKVEAFTVDREYLKQDTHEGLPVVAFEDLATLYPPDKVKLIIPLGCIRINGLRMARFDRAIELGYDLINYVSTRASVWPNQNLGKNCLIYEHAVIQPFSEIGDNVIIRSAAHISHHCVIGSHSFIAAGATFGGNVKVEERCFIGLGAVIRNGLKIASRSFIGAGAVVISDTDPDGVYVGNPAKKLVKSSMEVTRG
jgi:sugar O-acyltransferase (sialic acid O-acetyltransferase NeuD family)